jgi:class 3 adenylate cyclase
VVTETRFAQSSAGPIAYRVDGATGRWLLVVPDRADPFGDAGASAFGAFTDALVDRGWQVLTLLDGHGPGAEDAEAGGTDRRMAAIQAVIADAGLGGATVLGVGSGSAPAALAVASDGAWAARLLLYGPFGSDELRRMWAETPPGDSTAPLLPAPTNPEERAKLAAELAEARESIREAQKWWEHLGGVKLANRLPGRGPLAGLGELARRPNRWQGGLDELMRQLGVLEGGNEATALDALAHVEVPTLVLDTFEGDDSPGLAIAARIRGSGHRALSGEPATPWTEAGPTQALLDALDAPTAPRALPADAAEPSSSSSGARVLATLLFTDIVASTEHLAEMGDAAWRDVLVRHHAIVRGCLDRFGGTEIDTAGDGFFASFPTPAPAISCALGAIDELARIGLAIRCGLHTGECMRIGDKLGGLAVHIGARIAGQAGAGEVLVSGTVRDLVSGSGITFAERGMAELKGLPGTWPIYAATGGPADV